MTLRAGEIFFFDGTGVSGPEEVGLDMTIPFRSNGAKRRGDDADNGSAEDHPAKRRASPGISRSYLDPGLGSSRSAFGPPVNHFRSPRATLDRIFDRRMGETARWPLDEGSRPVRDGSRVGGAGAVWDTFELFARRAVSPSRSVNPADRPGT